MQPRPTFGNKQPQQPQPAEQRPSASFGQRPAQPQPAPQAPSTPPPPPAGRPAARSLGGGLAPANPDIQLADNFERRDQSYWESHPLRAGKYEFVVYVNKVIAWASGGIVVELRVVDWDRDANRPGEHHGRTIDWPQTPRADLSEKAYAYWRRRIVTAYTECGWPEDQWPPDDDGHPATPWHLFFVETAADKKVVPVVLLAKVSATKGTKHTFVDVNAISVLDVGGGEAAQAPLPYSVPPALAEFHGWAVAKTERIGREAPLTEVAVLDRNQISMGHLGMRTYKDL